MTSTTDGWAQYYPTNPSSPAGPLLLLARTTDGGRTWTDVTPPAARAMLSPANSAEAVDPVDGEHAYLAVSASTQGGSGPASSTVVFASADGGVTWKKSAPFTTTGPAVRLTFAGLRLGWLLPDTFFGGRGRPNPWLYRTVDGGAHWSSVSAPPPGWYGDGNDFCRPMALVFGNASTGWLTVSCRSGSRFFVTHDGGVTWSVQSLPISLRPLDDSTILPGPQFAGGAGFLTVAFGSGTPVLLGSQDSGQTWHPLTLPPAAGQYPQVRFFSAEQGMLIAAGSQAAIGDVFYLTADGGKTWAPVLQGTHFTQNGAAVEFTSPQDGIAWILGGDSTGTTPPPIYVTDDSGHSWRAVIPKLVG
jgi:photosystem II stability/assembly factor-like uncharacterized protein